MIDCPFCDTANIPGSDYCDECGQSLSHDYGGPPVNAIERALVKDRINTLEQKEPCTVPPNTPVGEVLHQMADNQIGCVMIVEDGKPVGIFTERDALMKLNTEAVALSDRPISEFMTANPTTLADTAKVAFALHRMDLGGYRHLPIVSSKSELKGIISVRSILGYLNDRVSTVG